MRTWEDPDFSLSDLPRYGFVVPPQTPEPSRAEVEADRVTRRDWTTAAFCWLFTCGIMWLGNLALEAVDRRDLFALGMLAGIAVSCGALGLGALLCMAWRRYSTR